MKDVFQSMIDKGIWNLASRIVVKTGYMRQNFIDAFSIGDATSNGLRVFTVWFDRTKFFTLVPYAMVVMERYGIMYPFVTSGTSGTEPVQLTRDMKFNLSEFASKVNIDKKLISIQGNRLVVRL